MSFRKAKQHFEQALANAQISESKAIEEFLLEGLLEMNKALDSELTSIESRLKTVEQLVRRQN